MRCMVIDVENLFMCVHKEEDADTKQIYFYLFKLLRKGILQMLNVTVEGPLQLVFLHLRSQALER